LGSLDGAPSRYPRSPHSPLALARTVARLRRDALDRRGNRPSAGDRGRLALPGPVPARGPRLGRVRLGALGQQPARPLLPPDCQRTGAAKDRGPALHRLREGGLSGARGADRGDLVTEDRRWRRYWRGLLSSFGREVDEELQFHVEMRASELTEKGMDPAAAAR